MLTLPTRDAGELDWVIFEQSGVLTTAQAVDLAGRNAVRGHIAAGRWRRICRGVLSIHNGPLQREQQLWVAVLAAGSDAVLAGSTALTEAGVRGFDGGPVHILIPADRSRTARLPAMPRDMAAVRVIRTRALPAEHLQTGRPPRTTTARSAVDAAVWAPSTDAARVVLAAACQQRRVTPEEIFEVLDVRRGLRRLALIRATMLDIAGGAQALSEIDFLRLCRRFGLPAPDQQERRTDAHGRTRYLDAYWRRWRLHVEVDGAHHMDARQWAADMARQNEVWIRGDRILRFPAAVVRSRPERVADQVRGALEAAGWSR